MAILICYLFHINYLRIHRCIWNNSVIIEESIINENIVFLSKNLLPKCLTMRKYVPGIIKPICSYQDHIN